MRVDQSRRPDENGRAFDRPARDACRLVSIHYLPDCELVSLIADSRELTAIEFP
jgi:hypothetical protein